MTLEELLAVAEIVEKLTNRYRDQEAAHKAALTEIRASFNARTIADGKRHEGILDTYRSALDTIDAALNPAREESTASVAKRLVEERDGLLTQVQDMRAEIKQRAKEQDQDHKTIVSLMSERDGLRVQVQDMREEIIRVNDAHGQTLVERDALRAEVAALQERLRSSIARGDFAQMEVAALKSQTSRHPVKVGEWVKRLTPSPMTPAGGVAKVTDVFEVHGLAVKIERPDGIKGTWWAKCCEPCDPPIVKREPTIGDTVRLVKIPIMGAVSPELQKVLEWPWMERWGTLNQTALVVEPAYQLEGALSVCLSTNVHVRWPICCVEVVSEATHDTEAGKAAAEAVIRESRKTEPVTDEIKAGDIIEVVSSTHKLYTDTEDIGRRGIVTAIDGMRVSVGAVPGYELPIRGIVGKCDIRKVTT